MPEIVDFPSLPSGGPPLLPGFRIHVLHGYDRVRPWRERLFSRPWRPFQRIMHVPSLVGPGQAIRVGNTLYCHPTTYQLIKDKLKQIRPEK